MRTSEEKQSRRRNAGCQGGCAGCGCVLTLGLVLALLGGAASITFTAHIPGTHANVTLAGSIGKKELTKRVLPAYARRTFGKNTNPINSSNSLTLGPAQGRQLFVVGKQLGAPVARIDLDWKRK